MRRFPTGLGAAKPGIMALESEEPVVDPVVDAPAAAGDADAAPADAAPAVPAAEPEVEISNNAENLETELLEVAEVEATADADAEEIDTAVEHVEALEALIVSLEAVREQGGLDRSGAMMMNQVSCYHLSKLGFPAEKASPRVSLESFSGVSGRNTATGISLEDFKTKAAEVWKRIWEKLQAFAKMVVEVFNRYFDAATKLEAGAKKLSEAAKGVKGEAKAKTFVNDRLAKTLAVDGKVDAKDLDTVIAIHGDMLSNYATAVGTNGADLLSSFQAMAKTNNDKTNLAAEAGKAVMAIVPTPKGFKKGQSTGFGIDTYLSPVLPGGKQVVVNVPTSSDEQAILAAGGSIRQEEGKAAPKELEVIGADDSAKIADKVAELAKSILAAKPLISKSKDLKTGFAAAAKSIGATAGKLEDGDAKSALGFFRSLAVKTPQLIDQPFTAFNGYSLSIGKAYLDYAEQSLRAFTGKATPKEETAAAAA